MGQSGRLSEARGKIMTELLYQIDSYLREFDAVVSEVDAEKHGVKLDRTAFYPGGGGQPSDAGELIAGDARYRVKSVEKGNLHIIEGGDLPKVGDHVRGLVDWERRYKLMRTHTAMHILCGVVWRDYGASVTGGNMEPLSGRMDFEFERLQKELVGEIEAKINAEVEAARDLRVKILPREEAFRIPDLIRTKINLLPEGIPEVRTVEIVGLDLQADGGTHVANTREVGNIRIADYKSKGGINKRIYIELDE
jgi:misacylated tRNA(Ala) deacylase